MQKLKSANILVIAGLATGLVGCGKDFSGDYQYHPEGSSYTRILTLEKVKDNNYMLKRSSKYDKTGEVYNGGSVNVTLKNDKYLVSEQMGITYAELTDSDTIDFHGDKYKKI